MFPYSSPIDVRQEYQARVDAALERSRHLNTTRQTQRTSIWVRLRAWLSARRGMPTQRRRTVDSKA